MNKSVYIYSNFNFSIKSAGVTRMLYYAQALAKANSSVYLVTCSSSSFNKNSFIEVHPNVFILENNTITKGFIGTYNYVRNLYKFSIENGETKSFIFYPSPLLYLELMALFYLKFIKKCKLFYELNEVRKHTSTFSQKMSLKRPLYTIKKIVYKSVFSLLEFLLPFYDGLICISTAIEKYGKKYNKNTLRIPILTNPNFKKELSNKVYSKSNTFNIGFSGSIFPIKENLLNFLKVLGELGDKNYDFTFNMCGFAKDKDRLLLEENAKTLKINDKIKFYGNLNAKELSTFLNQQQLLVIPRGYTLQNNYGFSTKLSDYLNHSKPVLVTDISDNSLFIKDNVNGFIVPTDDNNKMHNKLAYIIDNYFDIHKTIQENANKTSLENFYYENFSKVLSNFLEKD